MNKWKQGKVIVNVNDCPECGSFTINQVKSDLSGKEWICVNTQCVKNKGEQQPPVHQRKPKAMQTTISLTPADLASLLLPFVAEHLGCPSLTTDDLELSAVNGDYGFQEMTIAVNSPIQVANERIQLAGKRQKSSEYYQKHGEELLRKRKERYDNQKSQVNPSTPQEKPNEN